MDKQWKRKMRTQRLPSMRQGGITNRPELTERTTGDNSNCIFFDKTELDENNMLRKKKANVLTRATGRRELYRDSAALWVETLSIFNF